MLITKYRVYFNPNNKELGYIEYLSSEGLKDFEIVTEEVDSTDNNSNPNTNEN